MKRDRRTPLDLAQPCWPGFGFIEPHGYSRVMIDGKMKYAHRLAYQLHVGPIPRGWEIDHVCHSAAVQRGECSAGPCTHRSCWNPAHLEVVNSVENSRRGGHPLFSISRSKKCRRGHDQTDPQNTYTRKDGRRRCRLCSLLMKKKRKENEGT